MTNMTKFEENSKYFYKWWYFSVVIGILVLRCKMKSQLQWRQFCQTSPTRRRERERNDSRQFISVWLEYHVRIDNQECQNISGIDLKTGISATKADPNIAIYIGVGNDAWFLSINLINTVQLGGGLDQVYSCQLNRWNIVITHVKKCRAMRALPLGKAMGMNP